METTAKLTTHPVKKKHTIREDKDITRGNSYSIDPRLIEVDFKKTIEEGGNPRVDYGTPEQHEELKASILQKGVLQNVKVFIDSNGIKHLRHGYRRMKAVLELIDEGHTNLKIGFDVVKDNEEQSLVDHLVMNTGKPLTTYEQAQIVKRLSVLTRTTDCGKLAKMTSLSYNKVSALLDFIDAAGHELKETLAEGNVSFATASKIAKVAKNTHEQSQMLDEAKEKGKEKGDNKIRSKNITGIRQQLTVDTRLGLLIAAASTKENVNHEFLVKIRSILTMLKGDAKDEEILDLFLISEPESK